MNSKRQAGFTLVELMVTIVIVAILLAMGLPSFQSTLRSNRLATTTNAFTAAVAMARSDAIKTTRAAGVCGSADGSSCATDGSWTNGWLVWQDTNRNGGKDSGEAVLSFFPNTGAVTVNVTTATSTPARLVFDARGRISSYSTPTAATADAVASSVTLASRPCPSGQQLIRTLVINPTGQLTKVNGTCS